MLYFPSITDNRIINGEFNIDQRNEFAAVTPAATGYACDGWKFETSGLGSALTFQALPLVGGTAYLNNQINNFKCLTAVQTAPASGNFSAISQPIEGASIVDLMWGTNNAMGIVVSFMAYSSIAGTYYLSIRNSAANRSYVTPFAVDGTNWWSRYSILIPGDKTGTWLNTGGAVGMRLSFDLGSGSTFRTTANTWAAGNFYSVTGAATLVNNAAATLYLSRVSVRPGPLTDSSPYFPRPYGLEKILCQRFFQKTFPDGTAPAQNAGVAGAITVKNPIALGDPSEWWQFAPKMAGTPTITTYNPSATNANWRDITAASDVTVSVDPATTIGSSGVLIATSGTVATLGDVLAIHATADAGL